MPKWNSPAYTRGIRDGEHGKYIVRIDFKFLRSIYFTAGDTLVVGAYPSLASLGSIRQSTSIMYDNHAIELSVCDLSIHLSYMVGNFDYGVGAVAHNEPLNNRPVSIIHYFGNYVIGGV